jgi:hypothetical protein
VLGCHHGFGCRLSGSKIQIAFLGETKRTIPRSRPASGRASRAGLVQDAACGTGAQRRLVLDETEHGAMLVQVGGPPASSKTATPNHVLPVIPGDRNELGECHSEATRGRSPVSRDRPTKIVLRRSVESALRTLVGVVDHAPGSPCHERHVQSIEHQSCGERGGHRPANAMRRLKASSTTAR